MRQSQTPVSPDRLRFRANPLAMACSASPWRAAGYLLAYLLLSVALFAVALTATTLTVVLAVTAAALPLLIGTAAVVRGCAQAGRALLGVVMTRPVRGSYPAPAGPGLWRRARKSWTSAATWRDLGYLLGLWVPLFTLALAAVAVWLCALAGVTLPLWYRHVSGVCVGTCGNVQVPGVLIGHFPGGPHAAGARGLWINSSPWPALAVAAGCLAAFLVLNYALVGAARLHARLAGAVLRRPADPLTPVRAVLAGPGPLGPLIREPAVPQPARSRPLE